MTEWRLLAGWRADDRETLPALRSTFDYDSQGRATGWLYAARQLGMLSPVAWPEPLAVTGKQLVCDLEEDNGIRAEACAFQAYRDGAGVSWHYDRDWDAQAILSLGATRSLGLRRTDGSYQTELRLSHGDLLVMPAGFQNEWEHRVPEEDATGERCSLVFRTPPAITR